MENKEGLKMVARAVEVWAMTSSNIDFETIKELKQFIVDLDKPRDFKTKNGNIIKISSGKPIKPEIKNRKLELPELTEDTRRILKMMLGEEDNGK